MLRCSQPTKRVRITFEYLDTPYGVPRQEEYLAEVGPHAPVIATIDGSARLVEDVPRVSQSRAFEGEVCACELDWLAHLPGRTYSHHRRYTVTPLE